MSNDIVYDIEADGFVFESTKVWTICLTHVQTKTKLKINPFAPDIMLIAISKSIKIEEYFFLP